MWGREDSALFFGEGDQNSFEYSNASRLACFYGEAKLAYLCCLKVPIGAELGYVFQPGSLLL